MRGFCVDPNAHHSDSSTWTCAPQEHGKSAPRQFSYAALTLPVAYHRVRESRVTSGADLHLRWRAGESWQRLPLTADAAALILFPDWRSI